MIKYYSTLDDKNLTELCEPRKNCWIHLEEPSKEEIAQISALTGVKENYLKTALDIDEVAHILEEENFKMISIDIPKTIGDENVDTKPLVVINTMDYLITVCTVPTAVLNDFFDGQIKNICLNKRTELIHKIMLNNSRRFLYYLKQIDKKSASLKKDLAKSSKNKELFQLLDLQESLVFFSASLSANFAVTQKLFNHSSQNTEAEKDILEDTILETRQAIEMCIIYREIIKNTMDAFASVVNNNQNIIIKFLTAITIILSIPMVIASFWGMNTGVPFQDVMWGFWVAVGISFTTCIVATIYMIKKRMF